MRNYKLLLATTAILSSAISVANAGVESAQTNLTASIRIYSPFNLQPGPMIFPYISTTNPAGSGKIRVAMDYNGVIDENNSNAQILRYDMFAGFIRVTGGNIGDFLSGYNTAIENAGATTGAERVTVGENYANTINDVMDPTWTWDLSSQIIILSESGAGTKTCGTVTVGDSVQRYNAMSGGALEVYYGGTFEMADNYTPTSEGVSCSGSVTFTFIPIM